MTLQQIEVTALAPSNLNHRTDITDESIDELVQSIKEVGIIHPLVVRPDQVATGHYEIICGERRWRAAVKAGLETVPAQVEDLDDHHAREKQITENLQRENINPMNEAEAFRDLLHKAEFKWTEKEVAERIGKSIDYVQSRLKLLDLCKPGQDLTRARILPITAAAKIAMIDGAAKQKDAIERCIEEFEHPVTKKKTQRFTGMKNLDWFIKSNIIVSLSEADFDPADPDLVKAAGSCGKCPKKTTNIMGLFDEITPEESCLDGQCYAKKQVTHYKALKKELDKKHEVDHLFLSRSGYMPGWDALSKLLPKKQMVEDARVLTKEQEKNETLMKDAVPVIMVGRPSTGYVSDQLRNKKTFGYALDSNKYHRLVNNYEARLSKKEAMKLKLDKLQMDHDRRVDKSFKEIAMEKFASHGFDLVIPHGLLAFLIVKVNIQHSFNIFKRIKEFGIETVDWDHWTGNGREFKEVPIDEAIKQSKSWTWDKTIYMAAKRLDLEQSITLLKELLVLNVVEDDDGLLLDLLEAVGIKKDRIQYWKSQAKAAHLEWYNKKKTTIENAGKAPKKATKGSTGTKTRGRKKKAPEAAE